MCVPLKKKCPYEKKSGNLSYGPRTFKIYQYESEFDDDIKILSLPISNL